MKPYKNLKTVFVRGYEAPSFDWVFNIPFDVDEIVVKSFSIQETSVATSDLMFVLSCPLFNGPLLVTPPLPAEGGSTNFVNTQFPYQHQPINGSFTFTFSNIDYSAVSVTFSSIIVIQIVFIEY